MATRRINVTDNEAWGKLVKTWATGLNYVDYKASEQQPIPTEQEVPPKYPRPTSFPDFVAQTKTAMVGLVFENGDDDNKGGTGGTGGTGGDNKTYSGVPVEGNECIGFVVVQAAPDTMVLRLPAKASIAASETALLGGQLYPLPDFYNRIFDRPGGIVPSTVNTALKIIQLHAERVGEYTINTCH